MSSSGGRKRSGSASGSAKRTKTGNQPVKQSKYRKRKYNAKFGKPLMIRPSSLTGSPFPPVAMSKLRYCRTNQQITMGGVTPARLSYRLNSVYDPDSALGNHQPFGFDQLAGVHHVRK